MRKIKIFFRCLLELCLQLRRNVRLFYFKAKWREENKHNKTVAGNIFPNKRVNVGNGTYGLLNIHWFGTSDGELNIGNYCSIAENVHFFLAGEHDYKRFSSYPFRAQYGSIEVDEICKGPIHVCDDVWIGFGSTILSGVTIGKGAVIAAGSVVAKDVPPYAIWIGNRVAFFRFDEKICEKLESIPLKQLIPEKVRNDDVAMEHVNSHNVDQIVEKLLKLCETN